MRSAQQIVKRRYQVSDGTTSSTDANPDVPFVLKGQSPEPATSVPGLPSIAHANAAAMAALHPALIASIRLASGLEIFGFRTHKPRVIIAAACDVKRMNGPAGTPSHGTATGACSSACRWRNCWSGM
jgi:hypothetical protein